MRRRPSANQEVASLDTESANALLPLDLQAPELEEMHVVYATQSVALLLQKPELTKPIT